MCKVEPDLIQTSSEWFSSFDINSNVSAVRIPRLSVSSKSVLWSTGLPDGEFAARIKEYT